MKSTSLLLSCSIAVSLVCVPPCYAHGGQYRGPGDIVPPSGGGGHGRGIPGPVTPGGGMPGSPGPSGSRPGQPPATGGGTGPGGSGSQPGRTGHVGIELTDDLSRWEFWWEFNKDQFLHLKEAVHAGGPRTGDEEIWLGQGLRHNRSGNTLKPTEDQIVSEVMPALKKALDSTEQRDITSSCMIALAKIGQDHPSFRLVDSFEPRLRRKDQEISETAALALGIAGIAGEREVTLLCSLVADDASGRKACDRSEVNDRTRSFATYGLGLLAGRTTSIELKRKVLGSLRPLLDKQKEGSRNLQVAAIQAIGLLDIDRTAPGGAELLDDALSCLRTFYEGKLGAGQQLVQSHCPTAIAKLIGDDHPSVEAWKRRFAEELRAADAEKRSGDDLARSSVIALGKLCRPDREGPPSASPDRSYSELLRDTYDKHRDAQTRYFALIALAEIGGARNRDALVSMFGRGKKALEKPWCALALGIYAFRDLAAREAGGITAEPDRLIGTTLADEFATCKDTELRSALAIGLGLSRWNAASDHMRACLLESTRKENLPGYLCIGLALMKERRATEDIHRIVENATRQPELMKQAAIALGKLGDKTAADHLQELMRDGENNLARLAGLATALGLIGDQRSISPLTRTLFDPQLGDLAKAFAAVALGGIADQDLLPWNSRIAADTNYRASVETLTDGSTGILDIL